MSSIQIHQDLYNFERKRKGFTSKQIKGFVLGIVVCIAITAVLMYALSLPVQISVTFGLCLGVLFAASGILTIWGLPADEWAERLIQLNKRGNAITWQGPKVEPMKGVTTRAYKKASKKRGSECRGAE